MHFIKEEKTKHKKEINPIIPVEERIKSQLFPGSTLPESDTTKVMSMAENPIPNNGEDLNSFILELHNPSLETVKEVD